MSTGVTFAGAVAVLRLFSDRTVRAMAAALVSSARR